MAKKGLPHLTTHLRLVYLIIQQALYSHCKTVHQQVKMYVAFTKRKLFHSL